MLHYVTLGDVMKNFAKYFYIVAGSILSLCTGIMTIIATSRLSSAFKFIDSNGIIIPKYHILIIICCSITLFLTFISSVIFAMLYKNDPEKNHTFQVVSLILNIAILSLITITYFVIETDGYGKMADLIKSEFGYGSSSDLSEISFAVNMVYTQLFLLNALHSCISVVLGGLMVKYSKRVTIKYIDEDQVEEQNDVNTPTPVAPTQPVAPVQKELSPTEQLKLEIEEMKQNLEVKKLKEEYAELYKQLNDKK